MRTVAASSSGDRALDARRPLLCAAAAAAAGLLAVVTAQNGRVAPSALVHLSGGDGLAPLARLADPAFAFVPPQAHYDGVYYYAIARDPLLLGAGHTLIDQAAYRYGHPFYGWTAWLVSLGQPGAVPLALLLCSLLGLAVAGWAVSQLARGFGATGWAGLVVAVSPGLLYATTVDTTEAFSAGLAALALLLWQRSRFAWSGLLVVALCLTKEQFVTLPIGLGVWELVQARRQRAWPDRRWLRAGALVLGPVALAGWYVRVHHALGQWPSSYQPGNLGLPGAGFRAAFDYAARLAAGTFDQSQIGVTSPPLLVATALVLLLAAVRALRVTTLLDAVLLGMVAITACQGYLTLVYPHELVRTPSTTLLLALGVLLLPRRSVVARR